LLGGIVSIIAIGAWGTAVYRTLAIGSELKTS